MKKLNNTNRVDMEKWMQLPPDELKVDLATDWAQDAADGKEEVRRRVLSGISESSARQPKRKIPFLIPSMAAALLVLIGLSLYFYREGREAETVVWLEKVVPNGTRAKIELPDGSQVHLNAGTKLYYPNKFTRNEREVRLEGEAYFDIAKNPDKPFVVKTERVNVRVLGTKFNLSSYADEDQVETVLLEGSVSFGANKRKERIILTPGQLVSYDKVSGEYQLRNVDPKGFVSWKEGRLTFKATSLGLIAKRLGRFFNVKMELTDETLKDFTFTGVFYETESLEQLLFLLNNDGQLQYEFKPGKIEIARKTILP